jgi:hypothetical protein
MISPDFISKAVDHDDKMPQIGSFGIFNQNET